MRSTRLDDPAGGVPAGGVRVPERVGAGSREALLGISMAEARELVADLLPRRAARYWPDFLASLACGYAGYLLFAVDEPLSVRSVVCFAVAVVALYRAAIFTHEIAHTPDGELRGFRAAWNVLCGVPLLVPSFLYEVHPEHHAARSYGTRDDGEYLPFRGSRWRVAGMMAAVPVAAPALLARFLVVAPLGWLVPPLRRAVFARGSALVIDGEYRRDLPAGRIPASWTVQEVAGTAYAAALAALVAAGVVDGGRVVLAYAVVTAIVLLNALRVLGAHRYVGTGRPMTFEEQVLDSVDYPRGWLPELWAPLGLRYHAVHHLFPRLPYHALPEARRRLLRHLPAGAPFRRTAARSLPATIVELVRTGARQGVVS